MTDTKDFMLMDFALTLQRLAQYDDKGACERLARTGSYSSFDQPRAVQEARNALERWKDQEHLWKERGGR